MNIESTTRQGINYQVHEIKIPIYHKIFNLLDRHLNYKWLVGRILRDETNDNRKAILIFKWTIDNIANQPSQLKIVDDHVWNIIVRGYGKEDQMADVFATLCNYAGLKAFVLERYSSLRISPNRISIAAVFFDGSWHLCDPYRRVEFKDKSGKWATIDEIISHAKDLKYRDKVIDYSNYFISLNRNDFDILFPKSRSSIQNPMSRFFYFLRTLISKK